MPEVKKCYTTAMTAAINDSEEDFLVWEMSNFFAAGWYSPPILGIFSKGLREEAGQPIPMGATSKIKGGGHFR